MGEFVNDTLIVVSVFVKEQDQDGVFIFCLEQFHRIVLWTQLGWVDKFLKVW